MIKNFDQFLNEDSLDDFDIDGSIARKGLKPQSKEKSKYII